MATATSAAAAAEVEELTGGRRFVQIAVIPAESDGDMWLEKVTVIESATKDGRPKLLLRSYYRNQRTQERVWDEPPSGASYVHHASPEMRARAEMKMEELRLTLEMIPVEEKKKDEQAPKKKRGFLSRFKRKEKEYVEDGKDLNLQRAIALSMGQQVGGRIDDDPSTSVHFDSGRVQDEEEEMALATALSLSANDAFQKEAMYDVTGADEDTIRQRALKDDRLV